MEKTALERTKVSTFLDNCSYKGQFMHATITLISHCKPPFSTPPPPRAVVIFKVKVSGITSVGGIKL